MVRSLPKMDALDRMPSSWSVTVSGLLNSMPESFGLQLVLQRVSTDLKGVAVVVDGQQITQPTGDGQRNADQAVQVAAPRQRSS